MTMEEVVIRELLPTDALDDLTDLLHRAYARLGEMGLNFTAVDQTAEVTADRIATGTCFIALAGEKVVGTIAVEPPHSDSRCAYYRKPDVAIAHQFAVDPDFQGSGLGTRLLGRAEEWTRDNGFSYLAVDTAEPAAHLVEYYRRRGFEHVDRVQWTGKTYDSVVFAKRWSVEPVHRFAVGD